VTRRAVLFDLDGTLLDTLEDIADSLNNVLRNRGLGTHPTEAYRYFVGSGVPTLVSRALPPEKRNDGLIRACVEAFRKEYENNWKAKTRPYEGVPELLDALAGRGVTTAVLSNKPHEFTELCIKEFFSAWEFAAVIGQRDGIPMKPDPAGAGEIVRNLGIPPGQFVYLGDSGVDMDTAVRAGMFPVGALWGFRSEEELRKHGALSVVSQPTELLLFVT
jgi:phosphoglycolate phosphatase